MYTKFQNKKNLRVLDIGCSDATFFKFWDKNYIAKNKQKLWYCGVDGRKDVIDKLKNEYEDTGNYFFNFDLINQLDEMAEDIKYISNKFDVILLHEIIEHLPKDAAIRLIEYAERVCYDHGMIIISTPNYKKAQGQKKMNHPKDHVYEYEYEELLRMLDDNIIVEKVFGWAGRKKYLEHYTLFTELTAAFGEQMSLIFTSIIHPELADGITLICKKDEYTL